MTYNGLGLQSYGRRARRAHFCADGLILVPYMDASAVSRLGQRVVFLYTLPPAVQLHLLLPSIFERFHTTCGFYSAVPARGALLLLHTHTRARRRPLPRTEAWQLTGAHFTRPTIKIHTREENEGLAA